MEKVTSSIPYNYITIKTTKSRIEKGLLAIPVSLISQFPKSDSKIYVLNDKGKEEAKTYTPYQSSSRECRIGGIRAFYSKYKIKDGDEIVIQILDEFKYKIIPEKSFNERIKKLENNFEKSINDIEAEQNIKNLSYATNKSSIEVIQSEFVRLSQKEIYKRKTKLIPSTKTKESVPASLRKILIFLYDGKCQISGFTFIMKNGNPYFEIHHIDSSKGNHIKNLLVVSPNIHAQFTYTDPEHYFDSDSWLRKVRLNDNTYTVFQIIDKLPKYFEKEIHS